jgi:hypothetical protein
MARSTSLSRMLAAADRRSEAVGRDEVGHGEMDDAHGLRVVHESP